MKKFLCKILGHNGAYYNSTKYEGPYCETCLHDLKEIGWGWFWTLQYNISNWRMYVKSWIRKFYCPLVLWEGWDKPTKIIHYCPLLPLPKKYRWEYNNRSQHLTGYETIYLNKGT